MTGMVDTTIHKREENWKKQQKNCLGKFYVGDSVIAESPAFFLSCIEKHRF